jgi:hypothetical protein
LKVVINQLMIRSREGEESGKSEHLFNGV